MIAEALEFIKNLKDDRPITHVVGENTYAVRADRTLGDVVRPVAPVDKPTLNLSTLTGFVDAFKVKIDSFPEAVAVHVESFDTVSLISTLADEYGRRHKFLQAKSAEINPFQFTKYYEPEEFVIALQGSFVPSDNLSALLRLCSNLTSGTSVQVSDDGFSQKVVVQEGGVSRAAVEIPPRIPLSPYRTFREVMPISSEFLVRMQGKKDSLPQIALFPVDGGGWKHDTALAVKSWLVAELPGATVIA